MTRGDCFTRCGCPVTAGRGVLHGWACKNGGARARAWVPSAHPQQTASAAVGADSFGLSRREAEVAGLLRFSNKEIAAQLVLSTQTIKNVISFILVKTGTRNRTACALKLTNSASTTVPE